jgi:hypothetical protein
MMPTPRQGYRTQDGKKVPSVTTIKGLWGDKGALINWGYRTGREHGVQEARRSLHDALDLVRGPELPVSADALLARALGPLWLGEKPPVPPSSQYEVSGQAAAAGTLCHDMIESHVLGHVFELPPDTPDENVRQATNGFNQYLAWREGSRIELVATEMGLVSERHRFGGTLDAVGKMPDGTIVLLDWKTSGGIYADMLYQLAGYALLLDECMPELSPKGFHILRIAKETADFYHHSYGELEQEKRAFILMRELYEIEQRTRRR